MRSISVAKSVRVLILVLASLLVFLKVDLARAHLYGASLEKTVGEYFVDIGHSEERLEVGDSVRFDLNIYFDNDRQQALDFTDAWVRISQGNKTMFAGNLHQPILGKAGMTVVFPEEGEYELSARYHDEDSTLVETTFPLSVDPEPKSGLSLGSSPLFLAGGVLASLVIGFLVGFFVSGLFIIETEDDPVPPKSKSSDGKKSKPKK